MIKRMLVSLALLLMVTVSLPAIAAETAASPAQEFEARQLWQAFNDDAQKTGQELLGKTVQISGIVVETGMSIYLTPNVRLSDAAGGKIYVTCVLPRKDTELLSNFKKGEKVTMSGRVYRFSSGNATVIDKESQKVNQ